MSDLLTVVEAANKLGVSRGRIHQLINDSRLPAEKLGSQYVIKEADLELVRERKRTGRPKKKKESE